MKVTYEEFRKTVYHTQHHIVAPLLGIRLVKTDFFHKNKYQPDMVEAKLFELYHDNIKKFE